MLKLIYPDLLSDLASPSPPPRHLVLPRLQSLHVTKVSTLLNELLKMDKSVSNDSFSQ